MMRKIIVLWAMLIGIMALCPVPVAALPSDKAICNDPHVTAEAKEAAGCGGSVDDTVFDKIPGAVTAVFSIIGIISVGMIIYGGVQYTLSQGDPSKVKKAKDTILYSIIGLVVSLSAYAITGFILASIS